MKLSRRDVLAHMRTALPGMVLIDIGALAILAVFDQLTPLIGIIVVIAAFLGMTVGAIVRAAIRSALDDRTE